MNNSNNNKINQQPKTPNQPPNQRGGGQKPAPRQNGITGSVKSSRGAAIRAQKRSSEMAQKLVNEYANAENKKMQPRANTIVDDFNKLKITFLGGLDDVGEKNCMVLEYQNDAIILDCGNNLG